MISYRTKTSPDLETHQKFYKSFGSISSKIGLFQIFYTQKMYSKYTSALFLLLVQNFHKITALPKYQNIAHQ